jgi:hypothetical protein
VKTPAQVEKLLGALPDASLPVALLPVHVQTRYVTRGGKPQLLVRVYPDELHVDQHEPRLTAAEVEWGKKAWRLAWPASRDRERERLAWTQLAERFGARRAEWIARKLRPTNLKQRPKTPPRFPAPGPLRTDDSPSPAHVRHLPDRFVVLGYQGGQRVLLEAGKPIPATLPVGPAFDDEPLPESGPDALPLDPGMAWLVDFAAAEKVGMGIRVALTPELAAATLDTLLVLGVNAKLTPAAASTALEAVLDAQRYTRGLSFLAPGTATNNTAEASTAFTRRDRSATASFEGAPAAARAGSAAAVAARLLGIRAQTLAGLDDAARTDELDARHLQTALWPVTGGYYLDQIMGAPEGQPATFTPAQLDAARRHAVDFVRHLGPAPTLRAGKQPYGVLPVTSFDLLASSPVGQGRFVQSLRFLREVWRAALPGVPRLAGGGMAPDALVEVLRLQPTSVGFSARLAFDSQFFAPTPVFSSVLSPHLQGHATAIRARLRPATAGGLAAQERFFDLIPADVSRPLRAPLVTRGAEQPGQPLAANYIAWLRTASLDDLLNERHPVGFPPREQMDSLLYLLLRHSVLLAYGSVARRILVRKGRLSGRFREPALVDIVGGAAPDRSPTLLRALLTDGIGATIHTLGKAQEPEAGELDELRASLRHLERLPVDALERQLRGCIDLFSYRLDAWITSLATRRLAELRARQQRTLALGAFGWVHDLKAEPRTAVPAPPGEAGELSAAREPGGFVHAPSPAQASAAAVLRSGYLARMGEAGSEALAIDLSSARVRVAESLLDGVRQGQSLGGLLGYRFERGLHERQLDRFIAGFRRISLLAGVYLAEERLDLILRGPIFQPELVKVAEKALKAELDAVRSRLGVSPDATTAELEPVAAASLTDGLALVRQLHGDRGVRFDRLGVPLGGDRPKLEAELAALDGAVDALGDALTAEGVFQLVRGNPARAAASVDAIAHGEIQPPELQFTQTPRPGTALTHRLVTLLGPPPAVASGVRATRRAAEPRLDAWLAQLVGDPRRVRVRAELVDAAGNVLVTKEARLGSLGISNTDALYLSASSAPDLPSDLERLLEHELLRAAPAGIPAAGVRLLRGRPSTFAAADLSLGEFLEVNAAFRQAALGARPLTARDFHEDGSAVEPAVDGAELGRRADRAVAALRQAETTLGKRIDAGAPDPLREALVDLVFLGIPEAVPASARGEDERLLGQARTIAAEAARRLAAVAALAEGFDPKTATPDARVAHEQARLEAVLGRGFKALPLVGPKDAAAIATAFTRSDALLGGEPLEALSWLQGVSRVRPGAGRLSAALAYAAALRRNSALALKVAQLPSVAGERWVGLPGANGGPPACPPGKLSLVAHLPQPFEPAQPVAGLVFDEWVELVPAAEVTTGVSFNYDAPGARPPQAILLAVSPPGGPATWRLDTLERILLETLELARLRAVDPQALGGDVLLQRALPALYVTGNLEGETFSTDFARAIA